MRSLFKICAFVWLSLGATCYGQDHDALFSRLGAIFNNGRYFYNVDGIEISSQNIYVPFTKKNIIKNYRKYGIKEKDLTTTDSSFQYPNYYISKSEEISPGTVQESSYYFIRNTSNGILGITFTAVNKRDTAFERMFIDLVRNQEIPQSVFEAADIDSINFAGRLIPLGRSCHWMGVNNVQCPYYGQMNWSVHKTLEDASETVINQYNVVKAQGHGKIISEDSVDVIFEGTAIKAKKAIYDFTGITSVLAGMSGGKTLTIYFVAAPVRQNYVSCVMSFWNNDSVNPSGLPPLLEEVMKLKKMRPDEKISNENGN